VRRVLCCLVAAAALAGCTDEMPAHRAAVTPTSRATAVSNPPPAGTPEPLATRHRRHRRQPTLPPAASAELASSPSPTPSPTAASRPPTVLLNPGHNGGNATHPAEIARLVPSGYGQEKACDTTGTATDAGYPEHAFNWNVTLRVAGLLGAHGVRVVFTRHSDHGVGPCVNRRAAIGNHPWVAAVVSIHADGAPASDHGFHVIQDSRRPQGATRRVARRSRELGRDIHATLVRSSGLVPATYVGRNGYNYRDDLAGLNLARRPATFLELGNMKNPHDAALQSSAGGRQRIAAAIAAGILTFLGSG
jgi:N-acetylmuramoyl-L-alanine amidase